MNRTNVQHEIKPTPTEVTKVLTAKMQIGEGPVWDAKNQRLLWVDIVGQELNVFNPADGSNKTFKLPDIVTSATPRTGGGVLLTLRRSVAFFDPTTEKLETIAEVEADMPGNRFNDGKTDRQGGTGPAPWVTSIGTTQSATYTALARTENPSKWPRKSAVLTALVGRPTTRPCIFARASRT